MWLLMLMFQQMRKIMFTALEEQEELKHLERHLLL